MSPFLKDPYTSPYQEVLIAGRGLVTFWRAFLLIALWPFALLLAATAVASLAPVKSMGDFKGIVLVAQGISQVISLIAQALLIVRVFRFVFLGEGHGATTPPPFAFGVREGLFVAYRVALLLPPLILAVMGLAGVLPFFVFLGLLAWIVFMWRLEFLFVDISLDRPVNVMKSWNQMGPVFPKYLLTLLASFGIILLPLFFITLLVTALLVGLRIGFLGGVLMAVVQLGMAMLLSLITARFYGRQGGL